MTPQEGMIVDETDVPVSIGGAPALEYKIHQIQRELAQIDAVLAANIEKLATMQREVGNTMGPIWALLNMDVDEDAPLLLLQNFQKSLERFRAETRTRKVDYNLELQLSTCILEEPGIGLVNLCRYLRDINVLKSNNIPYQRFIDLNFFAVENRAARVVHHPGMYFIKRLLDSEDDRSPWGRTMQKARIKYGWALRPARASAAA